VRKFGLSSLITLADKSIILPVGGFGLIDTLSGLTFLGEWLNRMVCAMLLREEMTKMGTMRVRFTILPDFSDITLIWIGLLPLQMV
jgi:hypothetical protein